MNFSISEILVILLIALLVIKPEQLPEVAFTLGRLAQTIRHLFSKTKNTMNDFIESVEKYKSEDGSFNLPLEQDASKRGKQ